MLIITQIVAVANLMPADDSVDELDSYMYQTVSLSFLPPYNYIFELKLRKSSDVIVESIYVP